MIRARLLSALLVSSTLLTAVALAQPEAEPAKPAGHGSAVTVPASPAPKAEPGKPAELPSNPPKGPADIMNRANAGRARAETEQAVQTGEAVAAQLAATTDAGAQAAAHAEAVDAAVPAQPGQAPAAQAPADHDHPHQGRDPHDVLSEPELPTAQPKPGSPAGTIEVQVVTAAGAPVAGADIMLGVMASQGGRSEQRAKSDAQGRYVFRGLGTGSAQAYRINVLRDGAKFSTTPFRLPEDSGYKAHVPLQATTNDTAMLFQVIGQTVVELRDDRLHVTQQARLANAGERVIVLPQDGLLVPLPEGFTAFTWQDQMSDQKGEELKDKGFRIRGSLPPGTVTLAWTFDVPRSGESAKILVTQPWRTYTYRVISEAPPGLKLRVTDFPEAEAVKDRQRDLLFTQVQRRPSEAQLGSFTIKIDGIPGPGPGRWIAVVLAALAVLFGLSQAFKPADDLEERKTVLAARKRELLALAKSTESEHQRGEIGPQFHAERVSEILTELALVLRDEEALVGAKK